MAIQTRSKEGKRRPAFDRGELGFLFSAMQHYAPAAHSSACSRSIDQALGKGASKDPESQGAKEFLSAHGIDRLVRKLASFA